MIYLDHHSTTPCDQRVIDAMMPWWTDRFANPHSDHAAGREVADAVEAAKQAIAEDLGTDADRLLITSGATESNQLAILGFCNHPRQKRRKIVTANIEHPSVLDPITDLGRNGFEVVFAPVDSAGRVDPARLETLVDDQTAMVSIGWANHEIGTLQDVSRIGNLAEQHGAVFHCDATQAMGRIAIDLASSPADLVTGSAHKFYGPRGVGLLVLGAAGRRVRIQPTIVGGGQQRGLRGGTLNVPGLMGMQAALRLATSSLDNRSRLVAPMRDQLWMGLCERIDGLQLNGPSLDPNERLAGNLNFRLPDVEGESLMAAVVDVAFSTGSACSSVDPAPSATLLAIGLDESAARRSVRMGVGHENSSRCIQTAIDQIVRGYEKLKQ